MSPRFSPSELFLKAQTDERLAALSSDGHGRAFAVLIERHRRPLTAHAQRLVGEGRVEDVVQEALLRAWRSLERGAEVRHVQAWLHRIVHNAALNEIARQVPPAEPLHEHVVDPRSAALAAEQRLQVREVLMGVSTLPERQRLALLGTELGGRSRRQLAAELGLSEGAVRQLVHRARDGVRAAMAAFVPLPLVTRFMKASGWLQGIDSSAGLHPAAEATAASGLAVGAVIKAGTAVLAVGALGGGLLLHSGHGRRHAPRAATPRRATVPDPHRAAEVPAGRLLRGTTVESVPVAVTTVAADLRAGATGTRSSSTAGGSVDVTAAPETNPPPPRRQVGASSGRAPASPAAHRQPSRDDSSDAQSDPSQSAASGGSDTTAPSSSSDDSRPSGPEVASPSQNESPPQGDTLNSSSGSASATSPGTSSSGQSSSDSSSSATTNPPAATGD